MIDAVVQSYAPQPNLISRPVSSSELLLPATSSHLDSLASKVNEWDFHAGKMDDDDLIWSAVLILEHVLNVGGQELERFKIQRGIILTTP